MNFENCNPKVRPREIDVGKAGRKFAGYLLVAFALSAFSVRFSSAQSFEWDLRLDTKFDNHERTRLELPTTSSKTLFSVRVVPVVGIGWSDSRGAGHSIMTGGSFTLDMGAKVDSRPVEPLLYYNYESPLYSLYAGKFERRHLIGSYSRSMWSGVGRFYDNVVDGFAMQYHAPGGGVEVVLDWDGMASSTRRESFRISSASEFSPFRLRSLQWLAVGYSLDTYHLASRTGADDGVVDHNSINPWLGVRAEKLLPWFESLTLQAGWLQSFDRDRAKGGKWLKPGGLTIDAGVQKWRVGIHNRFYTGDTQMPLWNLYGNRIYKGDPMYASVGTYNYTQIYWRPTIGRGVDLNLELGLHSDGRRVGFQQVIWVGVTLNDEFFHKK